MTMEDLIPPTPAVFAGGLARTFEYRTAGVHSTPQVRWSFTTPGTITCPVLVEQGVIYLADDQGYFSALDAGRRDVLWSFHAETEKEDGSVGIPAFCLGGKLGYVATRRGMLYELDLKTGQAIRSWNLQNLGKTIGNSGWGGLPEDVWDQLRELFLCDQMLFFLSNVVARFDLATERISIESSISREESQCLPSIYSSPEAERNIIFGFAMITNSGDMQFGAQLLSGESLGPLATSDDPNPILWGAETVSGEFYEVGDLSYCMMPIMDGVLYASTTYYWGPNDGAENPEERIFSALIAIHPLTGAVQWRYEYSEDEEALQLAAAAGLIFLRLEDRIEAVDIQTYQRRWSWQTEARTLHLFVADSLVYVFDEQGVISALDAQSGEQRWSWQMEGDMLGEWQAHNQAIFGTIADGTLYVVAGNTLFVCSASTGEEAGGTAAHMLDKQPQFDIVPELIRALNSRHAKSRQAAARRLGKLKDLRATEPLMQALGDGDQAVCISAIQALVSLEAISAIDALITCLTSEHEQVVIAAIGALVAIEALIACLPSEYEQVVITAIGALERLNATSAVPALLDTFRRVQPSTAWKVVNAPRGQDIYGDLASGGYNLLTSIVNVSGLSSTDKQVKLADLMLDPTLSNNGGPTQTLQLLPGNRAIDVIPVQACRVAITDAVSHQKMMIIADQRGDSRPDGSEQFCDVGAYESASFYPIVRE